MQSLPAGLLYHAACADCCTLEHLLYGCQVLLVGADDVQHAATHQCWQKQHRAQPAVGLHSFCCAKLSLMLHVQRCPGSQGSKLGLGSQHAAYRWAWGLLDWVCVGHLKPVQAGLE